MRALLAMLVIAAILSIPSIGVIAPISGGSAALAMQVPGGSAAPAPPSSASAGLSARSIEVLRLDCSSRLGRREVTLFGNGTIRLRDGPAGKVWMGLAELGPDELQGTLRRLAEEDFSGGSDMPQTVVGDWVEKCDLVLALPDHKRQALSFGRYDSLPLGVSRVRRVAEELGARVLTLRDAEQLPERYEPRFGDVLKRVDGNLFQVVNFTSDKKGVELDGVEQPLHLIVLKEQMRMEFVALVSRQR